jgi:predicted acylesterase/phospholipase RssA
MRRQSGIVPDRLAALDAARFDWLHHGVRGFGVVCHDRASGEPWYFSTAQSYGAPLAAVVKASGAVPVLFPPRSLWVNGQELRLTDGGISDPLPVDFARQPGLDATHVIVSDCLRGGRPMIEGERIVHLTPRLRGFGAIPSVSFSLESAVDAGEAAVSEDVLAQIRAWGNQ